MKNVLFAIFIVVLAAVGASFVFRTETTYGVFTLYKDGSVAKSMRVHVATFDSANGGKLNNENCNVVLTLLQRQPGNKSRYWCEPGRFDSDEHTPPSSRS